MSLKMKLTSTVCAFFLILGLVIMGVFASPQASVNLGGTITFHATDVYANVYGSITGAVESVDAGGTLSLTTLNFKAGETTDTSSWEDVPLTFNDNGGMIIISVTIENLATDRPLYATINDNYGTITNVTKGMKKGEATYTGDCLTIPQKSGDDTNKVTINLTMEVKDKNFSLTDGLRYGYIVDLSNEEIVDTAIVKSNNQSLGTVTENVVDGILTVEVQPQEGAQFVGFRKTASGEISTASLSDEEFLNFNVLTDTGLIIPVLGIQIGALTYPQAKKLMSEIIQNTFMDYSVCLKSPELVSIAQMFVSEEYQEMLAGFEAMFPGLSEILNIIANEKWSYSFNYVEGDKYQAVFTTSETKTENGYTYEIFPDVGFSFIKKFDLPDNQSTEVTLASTLGGHKVLGLSFDEKIVDVMFGSMDIKEVFFTDKCTSITFPDSYKYYPTYLCYGLKNLKTVKIGNGAAKIPSQAFFLCENLQSVTLPENINSIGSNAFCECRDLSTITIPSSVTSIGEDAFFDCFKLAEIVNKSSVEITNESYGLNTNYNGSSPNINFITSEEDLTLEQVGDFVFHNYQGTNYLVNYLGDEHFVSLPESYKGGNYEIRAMAFRENLDIVQFTIPSAVSGIGNDAFYGCERLVEIVNNSTLTITNPFGAKIITSESNTNIEQVGDYIFYKNGSVNYLVCYVGNETELVLPDNFKGEDYQIRSHAFYECDWLTSVVIGAQCTHIQYNAFSNSENLKHVSIGSGITNIDSGAFDYCNISTITVDSNNTVFDSRNDCNAVIKKEGNVLVLGSNNTIIPNDVLAIGSNAFCGRTNITTIEIPTGVASIGSSAFEMCGNLESIVIPNGVTTLEVNIFCNCSKLSSIVIPVSVTTIDDLTFQLCFAITDVYYEGSEEQWNALIENRDPSNDSLLTATIHYNYVAE